jgi:hypothetical protein
MLTLLLVVLSAGIFCAALVNPSVAKAAFVYSSTLAVLSAATLTAIAKGRALPFVWGFAVMGWIYFAASLAVGGVLCDYLLTHWLLGRIAGLVVPEEDILPYADISGPHGFFVIGHCLWTLILATVGGLAATWLQRPRNNNPQDQH